MNKRWLELINYAFLAHAVITTEEVVSAMRMPA
jgi:hypothetical protein